MTVQNIICSFVSPKYSLIVLTFLAFFWIEGKEQQKYNNIISKSTRFLNHLMHRNGEAADN